jgi:hypothetical protein
MGASMRTCVISACLIWRSSYTSLFISVPWRRSRHGRPALFRRRGRARPGSRSFPPDPFRFHWDDRRGNELCRPKRRCSKALRQFVSPPPGTPPKTTTQNRPEPCHCGRRSDRGCALGRPRPGQARRTWTTRSTVTHSGWIGSARLRPHHARGLSHPARQNRGRSVMA